MEGLKKQRSPLRASVTKAIARLNEMVANKVPKEEVEIAMQQLEEKTRKLLVVDEAVLDIMREEDCSQEVFDAEYLAAEEYKENIISIRLLTRKYLDVMQVVPERKKFKLPVLELKRFIGEPREFLAFWSQFSKIHDDIEIPEEDKFQYLLQATGPESRAARLVESFPPTKENYAKAISQLKNRFGREDFLVQSL